MAWATVSTSTAATATAVLTASITAVVAVAAATTVTVAVAAAAITTVAAPTFTAATAVAACCPCGGDVQGGRTRGEWSDRGATGHGQLSLMAARASIGRTPFYQASPRENSPLPTRPASELSTPNSYAEPCADEYSAILRQALDTVYNGLTDAGTSVAT